MKKLRKRTIKGGVKNGKSAKSERLSQVRGPFLSYMKTPNLTPTTPSKISEFIKFAKTPLRSYATRHITSFLGDEEKLQEEFLEFVRNFEGDLVIRNPHSRDRKTIMKHFNRTLLEVTHHERVTILTPETIGIFKKGELKKQRGLYDASFKFENYIFQFRGTIPIPQEILDFLHGFKLDNN